MMTIDQTALDGLTEIFRVLGDPTRLRILDALSRGELCVGDLASRLHLTESAVSHQLRLLRGARIVRPRRDGRMIFYSLDDTHVLTLFEQGLRHVQEAGHQPATSNGVQPARLSAGEGGPVPPAPGRGSSPELPAGGGGGGPIESKPADGGGR